jgi:hypothetical protein
VVAESSAPKRFVKSPAHRLVTATFASLLMTGTWVGLEFWLWQRTPRDHPLYSNWTESLARQWAFAFAAWFVTSPESFTAAAGRMSAAIVAGILGYLGNDAYLLSIIAVQSASHNRLWDALCHTAAVWWNVFIYLACST